jgi:TPR repeat protein
MAIYPINDVPQFIWEKIIQFLEDPKNLTLTRRVSKQFQATIDDPKWEPKWRRFVENRFLHLKHEYECKEKINWVHLFLQYAKNERKVNEALSNNQKQRSSISTRFESSKIIIDEYLRLNKYVDQFVIGCRPLRMVIGSELEISRLEKYISTTFPAQTLKRVSTILKNLGEKPENDSIPEIQYYLGLCHSYNICARQAPTKAFKCYQKAAKLGFAPAQFELGKCYERDKTPNFNFEDAFGHYQKAAEQGFAPAQFKLGMCHDKGCNPLEALRYFKMAAEQGLAEAQHQVGMHYSKGKGTPINPEGAFKYFKMAAEQGVAEAQFELGVCYYNGFGTLVNLEKAFKYYQIAAEHGCAAARYDLGACYENGIGTIVNLEKAFIYYLKASYSLCVKQQRAAAEYDLGRCYEKGIGTPVNPVKAFDSYKDAAKHWSSARYALGRCYEKGIGTPVNFDEAFRHYHEAAEQGWVVNQHDPEHYIDSNPRVMERHHSKAAELDWTSAQYDLGRCYENGIGTTVDPDKAFLHYQKAADRGFVPAKQRLEELSKKRKGDDLTVAVKKKSKKSR